MTRCALIVGGLGLVGRGLVDHLLAAGDWEVVAVSRRKPDFQTRARYVSADALDLEDCRLKLRDVGGITHLFYAANNPSEEVEPNLRMLQNVVTAVEEISPDLQHVNFMQGTKAYGTHFGPYKTPAKESDPRHFPPNWYYDQEDFIRARSVQSGWSWSAMRPRIICGPYARTPYNTSLVIGVYATLCKHYGLPLRFPGVEEAYKPIVQLVDTAHLAKATVWAATTAACAGEIFNVTNGGLFRWQHLWPQLARSLGMECAPPQAIRLSQAMRDKRSVWCDIVRIYNLAPHDFSELLQWEDSDFVFNTTYDSLVDTTKLHRFGFHDIVDDLEMFQRHFERLRAARIIP